MNQSEREWTQQVQQMAMEIVGICGLLDMEAPDGSKEKARGHRAGLKALALAQSAMHRLTSANVAAEHLELASGGYNLAALATAPPATIEE